MPKEGPREHRCFGPPGTGKTTWMTRQIHNAVEKHGSEAVLVASFTRAAAAELAGRQLPLDKEQVGTLHAHCYRALGMPAIADLLVEEFSKEYPHYALSRAQQDALEDQAFEPETQTEGDRLYMAMQVLRAQMRSRELWPLSVQRFARAWDDFKAQTGTVDFTDMVELALRDIDTPPGGRTIGFYDEAQDFTPLELALIRKWARGMEYIILAGDDDQTLYSFKGATPDAFLDPPVSDDRIHILRQSYRVPRRVQEVAERWVGGMARRQPKEYKPRDVEGEVRALGGANWKAPERAVADAERYLAAGKTVMFLTSCSYMLEPLKKVLRAEGIPFHNPYRRRRMDWNPLHAGATGKYRKVTVADRVLAFLRMDAETWGEAVRLWTPEDLKLWALRLNANKAFQYRGAKKDIEEDRIPTEGNGWVSINFLVELFGEEVLGRLLDDLGSRQANRARALDWLAEHLTAAHLRSMSYPIAIAKKRGGAALREEPRVIVGTIHSVKGGEADVVYLFPDLSYSGMVEWQAGGVRSDPTRRLFYVGMTRCRESLVLCSPATAYHVRLPVAA